MQNNLLSKQLQYATRLLTLYSPAILKNVIVQQPLTLISFYSYIIRYHIYHEIRVVYALHNVYQPWYVREIVL